MSSEHTYRCWQTAGELLAGLETRDLRVIQPRLKLLRETLAERHRLRTAACGPGAFLWLEQLDLLDGIAESVEASLEAIRRTTGPHVLRMQTAEALLRHLLSEQSEPATAQAAEPLSLPIC